MEIFAILGPHFHRRAPIGVKFCMAKRAHVPLGCVKFHVNQCNESPRWGENVDIRHVSNFKYQLTLLCGVLPVNNVKMLYVTILGLTSDGDRHNTHTTI